MCPGTALVEAVRMWGESPNQQHLRLEFCSSPIMRRDYCLMRLILQKMQRPGFGRKMLNLELSLLRGEYWITQRKNKKRP